MDQFLVIIFFPVLQALPSVKWA